jgi:MFS family permease
VLLPPIFTAHVIDRLHRYMPLLLVTGIFQRLPYLLAALALLYGAAVHPAIALAGVALAPLVSGAFCGVGFTAWQQLVIRTIPDRRRCSLFAVRSVICCALGLAGGWVVKMVLAALPGVRGYGILHLCAFGILALSYAMFAMIREPGPHAPPAHEPLGLLANLRAMPGLVRRDRRLALYLTVSGLFCGIFILMPFLAIRAREVLGRPESYLGELLILQMTGALVGNLLSGYLGDRFGGKCVVMMSGVVFVALACWSAIAGTDAAWRAIFFLFGFAFFSQMIGGKTLSLEICPATQRATYLAILAFVRLVSMLTATAVSGAVANGGGRFAWLSALTAGCVLVSMGLLLAIREPRRDAAATE